MSNFISKLKSCENVAHETLGVVLERPEGFTFSAGQYIDVSIPELHYTDDLGPVRSFSIASAPEESDLLLVMRMRPSAFKKTLVELPEGAQINFEGPLDDLSLSLESDRPIVLLAGGVGIAPFLSGLREMASKGINGDITLFYSNPRPEDATYLSELEKLTDAIPGLRLIATMTQMQNSQQEWSGITGRINLARLSEYLPSLKGPRYFISGSPGFISGFVQLLQRSGVPVADVEVEMYTGY